MTSLSSKGKKRRKRIPLLDGNNPYGPLRGGRHNPRASELPQRYTATSGNKKSRAFVQAAAEEARLARKAREAQQRTRKSLPVEGELRPKHWFPS